MSTVNPDSNPDQPDGSLLPQSTDDITPTSPDTLAPSGHGLSVPPDANPLLGTAMDLGYEGAYQAARRLLEKDAAQKQVEQLEARLTNAETRDSLTGLLNMTGMKRAIHERLARPEVAPFGVLFMDLNNFKSVNDSYGHNKGDAVLQEVAECLRAGLRTPTEDGGDTIARNQASTSGAAARVGGDEFVVLVDLRPRTADSRDLSDEDRLDIVAARIQGLIDRLASDDPDLTEAKMGAAIGGVVWSEALNTEEELLRAADTAMYQKKQNAER